MGVWGALREFETPPLLEPARRYAPARGGDRIVEALRDADELLTMAPSGTAAMGPASWSGGGAH